MSDILSKTIMKINDKLIEYNSCSYTLQDNRLIMDVYTKNGIYTSVTKFSIEILSANDTGQALLTIKKAIEQALQPTITVEKIIERDIFIIRNKDEIVDCVDIDAIIEKTAQNNNITFKCNEIE